MKIIGTVIKTERTFSVVRSERPASCAHCANASVCSKKVVETPAINEIGAKIGDVVAVDVREDSRSMLMFAYIFLIPVAILFLSAWLYTLLPWLALIAIPLTLTYVIILRRFNANWQIRATITDFAKLPQTCEEQNEKEES